MHETRHSRRDVEGYSANNVLPQRDVQQLALVQGQNCSRCWVWYWYPQYVCGESWRQACSWGEWIIRDVNLVLTLGAAVAVLWDNRLTCQTLLIRHRRSLRPTGPKTVRPLSMFLYQITIYTNKPTPGPQPSRSLRESLKSPNFPTNSSTLLSVNGWVTFCKHCFEYLRACISIWFLNRLYESMLDTVLLARDQYLVRLSFHLEIVIGSNWFVGARRPVIPG